MDSDTGGERGGPRVLRSSSSCLSLAFIDVAFADIPLSSEGREESVCELQVLERPSASEGNRRATSVRTLGASQQNTDVSDGRTHRASLTSRFFLRELFHGVSQAESIGDNRSSRGSTCSSECIDLVVPSCLHGGNGEPHTQVEELFDDVAVFTCDPADKVKYPKAMTWRVLWASGGLLLVVVMATASISHIALGHVFKTLRAVEESSRLEAIGSDDSHSLTGHASFVTPDDWRPPQIAADSLYAVLVLFSIFRWFGFQWRLRAVVLMRFVTCLFVGLVLKVVLSVAFGVAYRPVGLETRSSSYADTAMLALRFVSGLTLNEDADCVPGYGRMIAFQLCVFWCLYTWHTPMLLLPPVALTFTIFILGSVDGMRSVFDALLSLTLVCVVCLVHHSLLDSAARSLFVKLRVDIGTQEVQVNHRQMQQRLSAVYTPASRQSRVAANTSSFYGYIPHGTFMSAKPWEVMSEWAGSLEYLEERVRLTLRSYGLYIAQQRHVHFVAPARSTLQAEERGLPVTSRSAASRSMHFLVDDRMVWTTICECHTPRPPALCAQQVQKVGFCLGKCKNRVEDGNNSPPQQDSHAS